MHVSALDVSAADPGIVLQIHGPVAFAAVIKGQLDYLQRIVELYWKASARAASGACVCSHRWCWIVEVARNAASLALFAGPLPISHPFATAMLLLSKLPCLHAATSPD